MIELNPLNSEIQFQTFLTDLKLFFLDSLDSLVFGDIFFFLIFDWIFWSLFLSWMISFSLFFILNKQKTKYFTERMEEKNGIFHLWPFWFFSYRFLFLIRWFHWIESLIDLIWFAKEKKIDLITKMIELLSKKKLYYSLF